MPLPKHHHSVPQMILNGFVDKQGWLHWCRLAEPLAVRRARPRELFYKKHLYSTVSESGVRDPAMEAELSRLEGDAAGVVRAMIRAARAGHPPELTPIQKRIWHMFFLMQWRRTPETQRAVVSDTELSTMLDEALDDLRALAPHRREEIEALAMPEAKARIMRNVRIDTLRQLSGNAMGVLERRGIGILRIRKPNKSFIVGSRPVVKLTSRGQTDLNNPLVEMWLPIASDVAAGVGVGNGAVTLHFLDDDKPVRQLNTAIASQSSIFAAASPALVRSLARMR